MKECKQPLTKGQKIVYTVLIVAFSIYCVTVIFPIVWAFFSSLKTHHEYTTNPPFALPETWEFSNYVLAINEFNEGGVNMIGMFFNSVWYSVGMVVGNVFVCSMTAYIIARYPFKGSNVIYHTLLIMMMAPIIGNGGAAYRLYAKLGILNSPLFVISNAGCMGSMFLFLEGYYRNVAGSYAEAGFIDGAGHWTVYFKIILPQAISMIAALAVMQFVGYWNDYATAMLYLKKFPTLSLGLYNYEQTQIRGANMPVYFAALIVTVVPVFVLFGIFQNSIMEKVSFGGLKG